MNTETTPHSGYFESMRGNKSSTRLIGFTIIITTLIFCQEILWFGRNDIVQAAIACGTMFLTIATPAMAYLFVSKQSELKSLQDVDKN